MTTSFTSTPHTAGSGAELFEALKAFEILEAMSASDLDLADIGVVRMSSVGIVEHYNSYESRIAGLSPEKVVGRHFFSEVAPCTNNFMVAHRFAEEPALDVTLPYVFTLRMRPTRVVLRLLKQAGSARQYLLVKRAS